MKPQQPKVTLTELIPFELYTPAQLKSIRDRVDSWLGPENEESHKRGVDRMAAWLERRLAFQTIATAMIAEGEVLLPGKNGMSIMARALSDFPKHAERLLELIRGEEEGK